MSQDIFTTIDPLETDGTELADILVKFKEAYVTGNMGVTRPPALKKGGFWVYNDGVSGRYILKMYQGSIDMDILTIDGDNIKTYVYSGENTFEIFNRFGTSSGPKLKLTKSRSNSSTQDGDSLGSIVFLGRAGASDVEAVTVEVTAVGGTTSSNHRSRFVLKNKKTGETVYSDRVVITDDVTVNSNLTVVGDLTITGTPTAPTAPSNTNNTQVATTAFVKSVVNSGKGKISLDNNFLSEIPIIGEDISVARCFKVSYHIYRKTSDGYKTLTGKVVMEAIPDGVDKWVIYEPERSEGLGESGISFVPVVKTATRTNLGIQLDNMSGTGHSCTFYYNIEMFEA